MMDRGLKVFILLLVVIAVVLRFFRPDLIFFNQDEGLLLQIVDAAKASGEWPLYGLKGTKGFFYGPVPSSIYLALSHLTGDLAELPTLGFFFNAALQLGTLLFFLTGLRRHLTQTSWFLVLGLMLSSPHLLLYSRALWDNTFLIAFTNLFAGVAVRVIATHKTRPGAITERQELGLWVFTGLLAGLSIGTHLMSAPLVLGMFCFAWFQSKDWKIKILGGLLFGLAMAFINARYFSFILELPASGESGPSMATRAGKFLTGLRSALFQWSGWMSWEEFSQYFANNSAEQLRSQMIPGAPWLPGVLLIVGRVIQLVYAVMILAMPIYLWKRRARFSEGRLRLFYLGSLLLVAHLGMVLIKDATTHPHYLQAVWWVPLLLFGMWVDELEGAAPKIRHLVVNVAVLVMAINMSLNILFAGVVVRDQGFPSSHFGASVTVQWEAARELCDLASKGPVVVDDQGSPFSNPARVWLTRHVAGCPVDMITAGATGLRLRAQYVDDGTAKLRWVTTGQ